MMANITKGFYYLIFILFFGNNIYCQVLIDVDLNPNGRILDVAVDPNNNFYIVVGDFTQIGGVAANHIAFIDRTTMQVDINNTNNFTSIDGTIKNVEYIRINTAYTGINWTDFIFFSGDFTQVNGVSNLGICRLQFQDPNSIVDSYHLTTWNYFGFSYNNGSQFGINDLYLKNDTLICAGNFKYTPENTNFPPEYNIVALKLTNSIPNTLTYPNVTRINSMFNNTSNYDGVDRLYWTFKKGISINNQYFFHASYTYNNPETEMVFKFDELGNYTGLPLAGLPSEDFKYGFEILNVDDTIIMVSGHIPTDVDSIKTDYYKLDGSPYVDAGCTTIDPFINYGNLCSSSKSFSTLISYKTNNVYYVKKTGILNAIGLKKFDFDDSNLAYDEKVSEIQTSLTVNFFSHLYMNIEDNVLFLSKQGINHVLTDGWGGPIGQPVYNSYINNLTMFCLEPRDIPFFVEFDSLVCPGDTALYQLPFDNQTDGFIVEFTGTGVDIVANNFGNEDLKDTVNSLNFNIHILNNFTAGDLKVYPYSTCNNLTADGIYAIGKPIVKHIGYTTMPNIYVTLDTTLNCLRDTVLLNGYSDSANVVYHWQNDIGGVGTLGQDTIITNNNFSISTPNTLNFIFQVTDTIFHCYNTDTVSVLLDTITPNINIPTMGPAYDITCVVDTVLVPFNSDSNNVSYFWSNGVDTTYNDTTILATSLGNYNAYVQYNINGCIKQSSFYVSENTIPPTTGLIGFNSVSSIVPLDTITCINDTLIYICTSSTPNTVAQWYDDNLNLTGNDTIAITNGNQYSFLVLDTINGCTTDKVIIIDEFTTLPVVSLSNNNLLLNCSTDSIILFASTITIDTTFEWTNPNTTVTNNDSIITGSTGWHYITVTRNDNGCEYKDSIEVVYEPTIDLIVNDTLVCDSINVDLTVGYVGNLITNPLYLWDNAQNTITATYNSGNDSIAIINVLADNGCMGSDTINIATPQRVQISIDSYAPCDGWDSGQLVINVTSGTSPFKYAINNGALQFNPQFQNLNVDDYLITVSDSLGCLYNFTTEVTPNGLIPTPNFIFSTYNIQADTIVLINVSSPQTDSVLWVFPPEITVMDDANINAPVIILPDTGVFSIEMQALYGTCNFSKTKLIYSSEFDTTIANVYNQNGIKSVELYPNPNTGVFSVNIEFYKKQNAITIVQDMTGYTLYYQETDESSLTFTHQIDLGADILPGTYILKVASEFDSFYVTFIINN
jgi:hypothetical protein